MDKIKQIGADRLAYEVCRLVQNRVIGTRSAAGDALLDYLEIGHVGGPRDVPSWMDKFENSQKIHLTEKRK